MSSTELKARWYQRLRRIWVATFAFSSQSLQQITTFLLTLLAARYLAPAEYGVYALAALFSAFLQMLTYTGFFHYTVRAKGEEDEVADTCFWLMLGLSVTGSAILFVSAHAIAQIFDAPDLGPVLWMFSALQPLVALTAWCSAVLMRQNRMHLHFKILMAQNVFSLVVGVAILVMWQSVFALVVYRLARALSGALLYLVFSRVRPGLSVRGSIALSALRFSYGLFGSRVLTFASTYGADLALGLMFTTAEVGLYRFGNKIATGAIDVVNQPMRSFAEAQFGAANRNGTAFGPTIERFGSAALILIGCIAGTIFVFGRDIVDLFFQPEYAGALMVAYAMSLRAMMGLGDTYVEPVLASSGHTNVVLAHSALWTAIQVAVIPLTAGFGMEVLAWTGAFVALAASCVGFKLMSVFSGVEIRPVAVALMRATLFFAAYFLAAVAIHYAVNAEFHNAHVALFTGLFLSALAGGAILFAAVRSKSFDLRIFAS
ncbi:oligosaccharide flippase family protein [Mangrovicoccus sp. HB161399]|uniref:oligosaccharide flippase family protein n=1 Tax=Mangrovicoccus sp. HB161399 TaxID=2720392 RepID=UPI0015542143|nr:oligosaccharide flippase family protein [Mangrovicoccus sp. HB161399]